MGEKNHSFSFFFETISGCIAKKITAYTSNPRIAELIEEAEAEYSARNVINVNYYLSYFYKLIYLLQESSEAAKDILNIVPVIRYIDKNYSNSLKVSELAKMAGMSESAFRKAFNIYTGMSPIEYRNSLRIRHAEELLLSGASISEAARSVGFNNITFFNRKAKSLQEEDE
jgi:AraC-like DNA-binding protein